MPRQIINNGTIAGDGTGESLFAAFEKINANDAELYAGQAAHDTAIAAAAAAAAAAQNTADSKTTAAQAAAAAPVQSVNGKTGAVIVGVALQKYLSAIHKPLSDQISAGASGITLCNQVWSKHPFVGIRFWIPNYLNAASSVSLLKAAVADTSGLTGTSLAWVQGNFNGSAVGAVPAGFPAAAGSVSVNDTASYLVSDPVSLVAIPRVDGGVGYLAQVRALMGAAFNGQVILSNTTDTLGYNTQTNQSWMSASFTGDAVTVISAQTLAPMRWIMPIPEFLYDVPVVRVAVVGDSIQQGIASTGNHYSAIMRACELLDTPTQYYIPANYAIAGQTAGSSRNTLFNLFKTGQRPSVICRNVWSPNTPLSSDTVMSQIKAYISAEISMAKELNIPYIIGTSGPVDNQVSAEYNRRYALNTWARGLLAAGQVAAVADWSPLVEDPVTPGLRLAAYADPLTQSHYNDSGYGVIAQCWATAIGGL